MKYSNKAFNKIFEVIKSIKAVIHRVVQVETVANRSTETGC